MARMPQAQWLGEHSPRTPMARYDIVCVHTIVGTAPAHAAHFSVKGNGKILQSRDTRWQSAANWHGNPRIIAIENEDMGDDFGRWPSADNAPRLTDAQVTANARILAWAHREHAIPLRLAPNSRPRSRGLGYHRQGCNGNFGGYRYPGRIDGGEIWSKHYGKVCPTDNRIAQLPDILGLAIDITTGATTPTPEEDDMQLSDKVHLEGEAAGKVLGLDEITVDGALGYAAAAFRLAEANVALTKAVLAAVANVQRYSSAQGKILIDMANGVDVSPESLTAIADATREASALLTAADVADRLDVTTTKEG